ncbi:MAG TPA: FmdB family zinc ribbon protein [Ideonella sp.]|uniref:FmdB family zinc ribbon protein n=1 Tax=Ideonella sp. TaxID=1929293 RepID=UPI002E2F4F08|nr:FmdB family zinc ribbon protein [Ideonella sp.]HEX5683653.1 FmdB family zinc ribbon protein [Ideonella sp.]
MPIYAYRCAACGHSRDVLQKLSDSPLTQCPACGAEQFAKQITAAGFQLKGSGWYATDFRNNSSGSAAAPAAKTDSPAAGGDSAPAAAASASPAAATGGGTPCGGSCACH